MTVVVVRTGGMSGVRRRWRVEAPSPQADHWIRLIERCPWSAPIERADPADPAAPAQRADLIPADRFVWVIRASVPEAELEEELTEADVTGPWRELIDAVRASAR